MSITAVIGALKAAFSKFAASTFGAYVLQAGASLIASQIASALSSPPVRDEQETASGARLTSLDGNVSRADAPFPRVMGSQRIYPPLMVEPLFYFDNGRELVEAVYGLSGAHDLEDIQINGAPVDTLTGLEIVTRDGSKRARNQTLLRRYGFTDAASAELTRHLVKSDGVTIDQSSGDISTALPQAQIYRKVSRADEFWTQITFNAGLHKDASAAAPVVVPFRLRLRPAGGEWRNLPELHYRGRSYDVKRATVRIIWQADAPLAEATAGDGWVRAYRTVPAQAGGSVGGWVADAEFDAGSGDEYLTPSNSGSTRLDRIQFDQFEARVYLDPASFAPGEWDIEITRGAPILDASFTLATYAYNGVVSDLFGWQGQPAVIPQATTGMQDACTLLRAVSVVNQTPTPSPNVATIALRARGIAVRDLSVMAHGLVRQWSGTAWVPFQRSDNPADIYRHTLTSRTWAYPFAASKVDDTTLLEWRARCVTNGWKCRGVLEDATLEEALRIVAGAGYARPAMNRLSVIQDYDRSAEDPVHVFTPRNSAGLSWQAARAELPTGLRVKYRDENSVARELVVLAEGAKTESSKLEQVEYESIQTEAEAIARAQYDMASGKYRRTVYSFNAPPAQLALLPGSLIGIVNDDLDPVMIAGSIHLTTVEAMGVDGGGDAYYITRGGDDLAFYAVVTRGLLDSEFDSLGSDGWGDAAVMADLGDMRRSGLTLEVIIQGDDGAWTGYVAAPYDGRTNVLLIDAGEDALRHGAEVGIIISGRPERMVVLDIAPRGDQSAQIIALPDASAEIWGGS